MFPGGAKVNLLKRGPETPAEEGAERNKQNFLRLEANSFCEWSLRSLRDQFLAVLWS